MIATALLLAASSLSPSPRTCAQPPVSRAADPDAPAVPHAFQNGERAPLRLFWLDPAGKRIDLGEIAPGAFRSLSTYVGHAFLLTDPAGRCHAVVRIGDVTSGTYLGTSRYRTVPLRDWHVFVDRSLDPRKSPAREALATIAGMLADVERAFPPAALAAVHRTPIFLHERSGPGAMVHYDPAWLIAHGRTVEMINAIEVSDAAVFIDTARVQPAALLHELSHVYHYRLPAADRAAIDNAYRLTMESGRYRGIKRHDGSTGDAYALSNASEYFAETSEAWFGRNDFYPFTRDELIAYDPVGAALMKRIWG